MQGTQSWVKKLRTTQLPLRRERSNVRPVGELARRGGGRVPEQRGAGGLSRRRVGRDENRRTGRRARPRRHRRRAARSGDACRCRSSSGSGVSVRRWSCRSPGHLGDVSSSSGASRGCLGRAAASDASATRRPTRYRALSGDSPTARGPTPGRAGCDGACPGTQRAPCRPPSAGRRSTSTGSVAC